MTGVARAAAHQAPCEEIQLARSASVVRLPPVPTWIVTARDAAGEEIPVGLVVATNAKTAFYRGVIKATELLGNNVESREVIVRPSR